MPDWLIERGIGETRMARIDNGRIVEARIRLDGVVPAGSILDARITSVGRPAIATAGGAEYLLPGGSATVTQGARAIIEVTREAIPGTEPWKRPLARLADDAPPQGKDQSLDRDLAFPSPEDRLAAAGWDELIYEARDGVARFASGELRIVATPAMTLIDVDGTLPPARLALAAAEAAGKAILRHGIGGSIGIDFPTVSGKAERQAIAQAFDANLPQPFERTAVNGFGFMQIVRPRRHASLIELAQDRAPFEARALLRRAARHSGRVRLAAHPAVIAALSVHDDWLDRLAAQTGGSVGLRSDARLPMSGGYAEPH